MALPNSRYSGQKIFSTSKKGEKNRKFAKCKSNWFSISSWQQSTGRRRKKTVWILHKRNQREVIKKEVQDEKGHTEKKNVRGTITRDNIVKLKRGKKLVSYFDFELDELNKCMFVEKPLETDITKEITFKELRPGEFKVYKMV